MHFHINGVHIGRLLRLYTQGSPNIFNVYQAPAPSFQVPVLHVERLRRIVHCRVVNKSNDRPGCRNLPRSHSSAASQLNLGGPYHLTSRLTSLTMRKVDTSPPNKALSEIMCTFSCTRLFAHPGVSCTPGSCHISYEHLRTSFGFRFLRGACASDYKAR